MWSIIRVFLFLVKLWMVSSQNGVSIRFMGQELTNGSSQVCLTDIGQQPAVSTTPDTVEGDALVCRTTNPTCCRGADGTPGGTGEWIFPNGNPVVGTLTMPLPLLYRNRGTGLVRLNIQPGAEQTSGLTGQYCCILPGDNNIQTTLCVTITLDDAVCNPGSTTDPPPLPTATMNNDASTGRTNELSPSTPHTTDPTSTSPEGTGQTDINGPIIGVIVGVNLLLIIAIAVVVIVIMIVIVIIVRRTSRVRNVVTTEYNDHTIQVNENEAYGTSPNAYNMTQNSMLYGTGGADQELAEEDVEHEYEDVNSIALSRILPPS